MTDALTAFESEIGAAVSAARTRLTAATSSADVEAIRVQYLGRTHGYFKDLSARIGTFPHESRGKAGALFNRLRVELEGEIDARLSEFAPSRTGVTLADPTMPARSQWVGAVHPVTAVVDEIVAIFREIGFTVALGPEAESLWYNFHSLNIPADHPTIDLHDTLYLGKDTVLRTHTSPVQMRTLQAYPPPIRILVPGNAHRRDPFDASHAPAFMQIEGLAVDEGITFADLKATLNYFARRFFGDKTKTRFRPSHFPFTEPSAELDVECGVCHGSGCSVCKRTGWVEIAGSGLVHPSVLEAAGVDSEKYTGWAFGMGPGRTALARHGIPDIRLLYDSDMRFLSQFAR